MNCCEVGMRIRGIGIVVVVKFDLTLVECDDGICER
jgi:hypothetical protein